MAKAVISNRIYMDLPSNKQDLFDALTYKVIKPAGKVKYEQVEIIRNYKMVTPKIISIPQGRIDLIPADYEIIDKRIVEFADFPAPQYELFDAQKIIYDQVEDSCTINALVGWGKSAFALHTINKFGQKALVLVHTTALRDQWIEEVQKLYGFVPGVIGSGQFNIDSPIVIGNTQSVIKHIDKIEKSFGTIVVDECLDYETQIYTKELGKVKLGTIVNNKKEVSVLSMNIDTKEISYKRVINWFKNPEKEAIKLTHSGGGSIKCTKNHNIFTYVDGDIFKVPAEYLEVGDYLLETTEKHKSNHILNKDWESIFLGLLLGDGSLRQDNKRSNSVRLSITHGEDQSDYLNWKRDLLQDTYLVNGKSGYCDKEINSITTKSFIDLNNWRNTIYQGGSSKRFLTNDIIDKLTVKSWAIIFQDDGSSSKESNSILFSFCEFTEESIQLLQKSLEKLFNIKDSVFFTCNKGYNYLRLNTESSIKFKNGVAQYIHPSMYYKLTFFDTSKLVFNFEVPTVDIFNQSFCVRTIESITNTTLTNGYRYNIEVEDNHTYFANGILVSNCHHTPATTFSNIIDRMHSRYRLALSGTLQRKDGKHILFPDYFGPKVYKPEQNNTMTPSVLLLKSGPKLPPGSGWAEKVTKLLQDTEYQQLIASIALIQANKGHKVLVIADRVDFLKRVAEIVKPRASLVIGETEDRKVEIAKVESGECDILCGSRPIFSEGISVNCLSCVILATPIANTPTLEQIIGRIMRLSENKLDPIVIDIQFTGVSEVRQNHQRLAFYLEKGWDIKSI